MELNLVKFVTGANFGTKEDNLLFKVRSLLLKSCLSQKGGVTYDALIGALKRLQAYALRLRRSKQAIAATYRVKLKSPEMSGAGKTFCTSTSLASVIGIDKENPTLVRFVGGDDFPRKKEGKDDNVLMDIRTSARRILMAWAWAPAGGGRSQ